MLLVHGDKLFKTFQITSIKVKCYCSSNPIASHTLLALTIRFSLQFYNLDKSICFFIISSVLELISSCGSFW